MKSEEEKYYDARQKTYEAIKAWDDLRPESRERLFKEVAQTTGFAQFCIELQRFMQSNR